MKKQLLFIAPDYYGFNEVVSDGLKKYSGHNVIDINATLPFQYKNIGERIHNFLLKTFFGKNLKKIKKGRHVHQIISQYDEFDLLIINRPDVLEINDLNLARQKCRQSVCLLWDSIEKIPTQEKCLPFFDKIFSFDPGDCENHGFTPITNFYFKSERTEDVEYDVALLMTYDNRIQDAIKIFQYFNKRGIKAKAKIFTHQSQLPLENLPHGMEVIRQIIPFKKAYEYYLDSKSILDLAHPHQRGLSFRPFEAIGLEKKLITNANLRHTDFYNEENIHIIENIDNIQIPKKFFENSYHEINADVKEKYFIKQWIQSIIL